MARWKKAKAKVEKEGRKDLAFGIKKKRYCSPIEQFKPETKLPKLSKLLIMCL